MVFCTDASPYAAGICGTEAPCETIRELWRHSEQRGFYTKLQEPAAAILRELGLEATECFGGSAPCQQDRVAPVPPSLREGFLFHCLEMFRGCGAWTKAHREAGLTVHPGPTSTTCKPLQARYLYMADDAVFRELLSLALRGVVREWHGGPPCLTFGTLRRPRLRSKARPAGFNPAEPLTTTGFVCRGFVLR